MVDLKYEKSEKWGQIFFSSDFDDIFFGYESDDFKKRRLNKKIAKNVWTLFHWNFFFLKSKKFSFLKSSDSNPKKIDWNQTKKKYLIIFFHDFRK